MTWQTAEMTKSIFKAGTKIVLRNMVGEPQMPNGLMGTVEMVDDAGQIHVLWENGSTLALTEEDSFEVADGYYDMTWR